MVFVTSLTFPQSATLPFKGRNYSKLWDEPCYVFHTRIGFGVNYPNVRDAYDELSLDDSWLILLQDGSVGIHRPEARWDDEKLLVS